MTNNIMKKNVDDLKSLLETNSISVCVIGIGRIGLPTALSFANSGLSTIGLDINSKLVEQVNVGDYPLKDEPHYDKIFQKVFSEKKFIATTDIEKAISKSDVILLSLPTPMDDDNIPDYSALKTVGNQLNQFLTENSLVIVESTIEPGFIENELIQIIEGSDNRLTAGKNFGIGVCPETANPGDIMNDFTKLPRLIGGINEKIADLIHELYQFVFPVDLIRMPDCKTANAVKLTTNVFRDVNIAFINELSLLFDKLGIDTFKVLEAAKSKYNFQVHYPGAGVGGPCLPVNSYQLLNSAKSLGVNLLNIIQISREVNEKMPDYVIQLTQEIFNESKKELKNSTIMILGVSYKPDVKDIQLAPAEHIIKKLKQLGVNVKLFDPFYKNENVFGISVENNIYENISDCDAIIIVTNHDEFKKLNLELLKEKMKFPIIVDSRGLIKKDDALKTGLVFKGLGQK